MGDVSNDEVSIDQERDAGCSDHAYSHAEDDADGGGVDGEAFLDDVAVDLSC